jgi:hypothetical protein
VCEASTHDLPCNGGERDFAAIGAPITDPWRRLAATRSASSRSYAFAINSGVPIINEYILLRSIQDAICRKIRAYGASTQNGKKLRQKPVAVNHKNFSLRRNMHTPTLFQYLLARCADDGSLSTDQI